MSVIEDKATQITSELGRAGFGFDPLLIVGIITALVQLLKACGWTAAEASLRAAEDRPLHRLAVRRIVRKRVKKTDDREAIEEALFEVGSTTDPAEFETLFNEVP